MTDFFNQKNVDILLIKQYRVRMGEIFSFTLGKCSYLTGMSLLMLNFTVIFHLEVTLGIPREKEMEDETRFL